MVGGDTVRLTLAAAVFVPSQPVNGAALDFGIAACSVNADILEEEFFAADKT
jgi:hypothetical protein